MNRVDIAYALKLVPAAVVRYFESKGLILTRSWNELWQEAHAKAFAVAHLALQDVLLDLFQGIQQALKEGITERQFQARMIPILQAKGWWGKAIDPDSGEILETYPSSNKPVQYGSPARLRLIYRQNMQSAYMLGRYQSMIEGAALTPYWRYVAVMDEATRPTHAALNGRVWRYDDPIWDTLYPPNGWGCRCRIFPITQAMVQRMQLTIESSEDKRVTRTVPAGRKPDGSIRYAEVTGVRTGYYDNGQEIVMLPDAGWSYNVGRAWQKHLQSQAIEKQNALGELSQ